jgi:hypothetical protein
MTPRPFRHYVKVVLSWFFIAFLASVYIYVMSHAHCATLITDLHKDGINFFHKY